MFLDSHDGGWAFIIRLPIAYPANMFSLAILIIYWERSEQSLLRICFQKVFEAVFNNAY